MNDFTVSLDYFNVFLPDKGVNFFQKNILNVSGINIINIIILIYN